MRKLTVLVPALFVGSLVLAQNPATTFTIANRNIVLPCGGSCVSISAQLPHIKQTTAYVVTRPDYVPFAYTTAGGTEVTPIYIDDTWSPAIGLPFPFCYYGSSYSSLLMGSNSAITFDIARAGSPSGYSISSTTGAIPNTAYAPSMIFGPYHDINPNLSSGNKKIEWRVEGAAPRRRFIGSYNDVPYFGSNCTSPRATHQMILYESTGIVEVYIQDKPYCTGWNSGLSILGMQDQSAGNAIVVTGKNATVWGDYAMDSCWRFIPDGGGSRLKSAQLLVNGLPVANADTSTAAPGVLNLDFPNVCPVADSTAYVIRAVFGQCTDPALDVVFTDTVYVKKISGPEVSYTATDADCSGNGSIVVSTGGGTGPFEYSIDGGIHYQSSPVFGDLVADTYVLVVRTIGSSCTSPATAITIDLVNNLEFTATESASICRGASFTPAVSGNAASYEWTPSTGVSDPSVASPVLTPDVTTQYFVTAKLGSCQMTRTVLVNVVPGATANAGPDLFVIAGGAQQLMASGSSGTYAWSPAAGLSSASVLTPSAMPAATTTYTLTITTAEGCIATDEVTVTVVPYCVKPMEAFTPNGDGINDLWLVTNGNCLRAASAQVFNRYGARVFESHDYKNNWDGTYKGKNLPDGTYYYILSYELINGEKVYLKGNLTILR